MISNIGHLVNVIKHPFESILEKAEREATEHILCQINKLNIIFYDTWWYAAISTTTTAPYLLNESYTLTPEFKELKKSYFIVRVSGDIHVNDIGLVNFSDTNKRKILSALYVKIISFIFDNIQTIAFANGPESNKHVEVFLKALKVISCDSLQYNKKHLSNRSGGLISRSALTCIKDCDATMFDPTVLEHILTEADAKQAMQIKKAKMFEKLIYSKENMCSTILGG